MYHHVPLSCWLHIIILKRSHLRSHHQVYPLSLYGYMGLYPQAWGVRFWTGSGSDKTRVINTVASLHTLAIALKSRVEFFSHCPWGWHWALRGLWSAHPSLVHACGVYGSDLLGRVSHTHLYMIRAADKTNGFKMGERSRPMQPSLSPLPIPRPNILVFPVRTSFVHVQYITYFHTH